MSDRPETIAVPRDNHIRHPLPAMLSGFLAGLALPAFRWLLLGDSDPFSLGWPWALNLMVFVCSVFVGTLTCRPLVTALALWFGMLVWFFARGGSEYPASSLIALTLHALVPAIIGAVVVRSISARQRFRRNVGPRAS